MPNQEASLRTLVLHLTEARAAGSKSVGKIVNVSEDTPYVRLVWFFRRFCGGRIRHAADEYLATTCMGAKGR